MTEEVDAVYTWVDGSDPAFRDAWSRHAPAGAATRELGRYRNCGELRFSVRSLLRFAPWLRHIHILTNGQVPRLDGADPRIRIVTHREVFPEPDCLPTFNSNAIEMCLHRIPGLSRRFLYFNDDVFLGRRVHVSDFFLKEDCQRVFFEETLLPRNPLKGSARDRACAYTRGVVTKLWGQPHGPSLLPAHAPQAYDREILSRLETLLPDEFRRTASHRFRSGDDLVLAVLYAGALQGAPGERGRHEVQVLRYGSDQYSFLMLENRFFRAMRQYLRILRSRPKFFCINDDMGDVPANHPLVWSVPAFLGLYFLGAGTNG